MINLDGVFTILTVGIPGLDIFLSIDFFVFMFHQDWTQLRYSNDHDNSDINDNYYLLLCLYLIIVIIYILSFIGGILHGITSMLIYFKASALNFEIVTFVRSISHYTRIFICFVIHPLYIIFSITIFIVQKIVLDVNADDNHFSGLDDTSKLFVNVNFAHAVANGIIWALVAIVANNYMDKANDKSKTIIRTSLSVLSTRIVIIILAVIGFFYVMKQTDQNETNKTETRENKVEKNEQ